MRWVLVIALALGRLAAQECGTNGISGITPTPAYFDGTNGSSPIPAAGGSKTVSVDTGNSPTCSWAVTAIDNATNQAPTWLTLGTTTGNGTGNFTFTVATNTANVPRFATLILPGPPYQSSNWKIPVVQQAASCTLTLPVTSASAPVGASTGSFTLQTNCQWNAYGTTYPTWLTLPASTNGTGNGTVAYTVAANSCVGGRTGNIVVGAGSIYSQNNNPILSFTVNQAGSPNNLSLSPATAAIGAAGGPGSVSLTTGQGCGWQAYSNQTWLTITYGASGTGSVTISYSAAANTGATARAGQITVGAQVFTLTQAAATSGAPQLTAIANAASYATGAVSPGEIIALGGTNIGPYPGVGLQLTQDGKSITSALVGVQVLFDGKYPAPLTYVSTGQVNAVVPYEIAGETTTQITLQYGNQTSAAFQAPVQAATPGIFTLDANGVGPGAILNQDYSVNGNLHPAARGSTVMIFCTGGGVTVPQSTDGALTPGVNALDPTVQPVTVTIGGVASPSVAYAGGAPGAVAGLIQINAVVPPNVTPGSNVPVVVQIGSWQSQTGVTMVVQ